MEQKIDKNFICVMDWKRLYGESMKAYWGQKNPADTAFTIFFGVNPKTNLPFLFSANILTAVESNDPASIKQQFMMADFVDVKALFFENDVGNVLSLQFSHAQLLEAKTEHVRQAVKAIEAQSQSLIETHAGKLYDANRAPKIHLF